MTIFPALYTYPLSGPLQFDVIANYKTEVTFANNFAKMFYSVNIFATVSDSVT